MADGTSRLCRATYNRKELPRDYLGGADAKMLHDAADMIEALKVDRADIAKAGWRSCIDHIIKPESRCPVCLNERLRSKLKEIMISWNKSEGLTFGKQEMALAGIKPEDME